MRPDRLAFVLDLIAQPSTTNEEGREPGCTGASAFMVVQAADKGGRSPRLLVSKFLESHFYRLFSRPLA